MKCRLLSRENLIGRLLLSSLILPGRCSPSPDAWSISRRSGDWNDSRSFPGALGSPRKPSRQHRHCREPDYAIEG